MEVVLRMILIRRPCSGAEKVGPRQEFPAATASIQHSKPSRKTLPIAAGNGGIGYKIETQKQISAAEISRKSREELGKERVKDGQASRDRSPVANWGRGIYRCSGRNGGGDDVRVRVLEGHNRRTHQQRGKCDLLLLFANRPA